MDVGSILLQGLRPAQLDGRYNQEVRLWDDASNSDYPKHSRYPEHSHHPKHSHNGAYAEDIETTHEDAIETPDNSLGDTPQASTDTTRFAEFKHFKDLPIELRLVIWKMALERTVRLRMSERANSSQYDIHTHNDDHMAIIWSCAEAMKFMTAKYRKVSTHRQCQANPFVFGSGFEVLQMDGKLNSAWQLSKVINQLPGKDIFEIVSISHIEMWLNTAGYARLGSQPLVLLFKNLKTVYINIAKVPWKKGRCALHKGLCKKVASGALCCQIDRNVGGPSFQASVQNMKEKVRQFLVDFNIQYNTSITFILTLEDERASTTTSMSVPWKTRLPFSQSTVHKELARRRLGEM